MACWLALLGGCVAATDANGQVGKLHPVDQAVQDPSLFLLRMRLLQAAATRDTSFIYSVVSPNIKTSFGGGVGVEDLRRQWAPENPESEFWPIFSQVLGGGGTMSGSGETMYFEAPYWSGAWDGSLYDAFEFSVVIGERVNVRSRASTGSEIIGTLSYDIIRILDPYPPSEEAGVEWVKVDLADKMVGFISADFVRTPIGYRMVFEKIDGEWMIRSFLAGD